MLAFKFVLRGFAINNNPTTDGLLTLLNSRNTLNLLDLPIVRAFARLKRYRPLIYSSDVLPCFTFSLDSQIFSPNTDVNTGRSIKKSKSPAHSFKLAFQSLQSSATSFYTDGSKSAEGSYVGVGIHSPDLNLNLRFRISSQASIASAEALAIQLTLEYIAENNISNSIIFTDSLSTIQAISNLRDFITSPITPIFRIKILLERLSSANLSIRLIWIPSHLGIPGNEKADLLAKEASGTGTTLHFRLPYSDFFPLCLSLHKKEFTSYLNNYRTNTGCNYFSNYRLEASKPWFHSLNLDRASITTFCRMRSNHHSLALSLFNKNIVDSPLCPCGEDDEDLNHVFWACSRFDAQRSQLYRSLSKCKLFPPFIISSFLHQPRSDLISILLRFLTDCDLLI